MPNFIIIETEDGLTVTEHKDNRRPEDTAIELGGILADQEIYKTYDDAYDSMLTLRRQEEEDDIELE
jgi:hypothetical protein